MVHALDFPLRRVGLVVGALTAFVLTPGSVFYRSITAISFAVFLSAGSRFRQIYWIASGMNADPPRGGEWAGATFFTAVWVIFMRLWSGNDMLLPMAGGLAASHAFAKLSCVRIGCCKWKTRLISCRGPLLDATISLVITAGVLIAATTLPDRSAEIGIIAATCVLGARIVSMSGQGRTIRELGSISLACAILVQLLPTG
jgi:hypothetical protein